MKAGLAQHILEKAETSHLISRGKEAGKKALNLPNKTIFAQCDGSAILKLSYVYLKLE